ncbi:hypothetical protein CEXT_697341 [Caerostris extrusa]|uniref:Uncharacterized protein n=1 Tax=Caerostris extrusa TaxID=172846 RepID=A0AAV4Y252_CAEEX|nr:hypothetical protein CEXT_697341 [Caerostris extrusa]
MASVPARNVHIRRAGKRGLVYSAITLHLAPCLPAFLGGQTFSPLGELEWGPRDSIWCNRRNLIFSQAAEGLPMTTEKGEVFAVQTRTCG